jgi:hypothetical protein
VYSSLSSFSCDLHYEIHPLRKTTITTIFAVLKKGS